MSQQNYWSSNQIKLCVTLKLTYNWYGCTSFYIVHTCTVASIPGVSKIAGLTDLTVLPCCLVLTFLTHAGIDTHTVTITLAGWGEISGLVSVTTYCCIYAILDPLVYTVHEIFMSKILIKKRSKCTRLTVSYSRVKFSGA